MRVLCFGGSFNPIHLGHLAVSRSVARTKAFDRVRLIVSADPPHKPRQTGRPVDLAAAEDRLAMCRLAVADDPLFQVDDLELHRTGPSYTLDTVRELRRRDGLSPNEPIYWLIGADSVSQLPTWHKARKLVNEVEFVVVARPGFRFDWGSLPDAFQKLERAVVEAPLVDISATEIRRRVSAGESIEGLTPEAVATYIREHRLYL